MLKVSHPQLWIMVNEYLIIAALTLVFIIILVIMFRIIKRHERTIASLVKERDIIQGQEQSALEKVENLEEKEQFC
ncbi:MAG: hypothetical protein R2744_12170 [Bacteroidales bacterium]